jgi:hypothetical protein
VLVVKHLVDKSVLDVITYARSTDRPGEDDPEHPPIVPFDGK